jgi:hypothetical protein
LIPKHNTLSLVETPISATVQPARQAAQESSLVHGGDDAFASKSGPHFNYKKNIVIRSPLKICTSLCK